MPHDKTQPNANFLIIIGISSALVLLVTLVFVFVYFQQVAKKTFFVNIESQPSTKLMELRASEDAKLMQYSYVDKNAGIARIPIEDAILLEAKESWRRNVQVSQDTPIPEVTQNKPSSL